MASHIKNPLGRTQNSEKKCLRAGSESGESLSHGVMGLAALSQMVVLGAPALSQMGVA